jgi:hypothetical protein
MAEAENCKPQAKDGWTDAAGVTVKEGKSGSNRRQRAKRLQGRRTLVRHKAAASEQKRRNTGNETQAEKNTAREEHSETQAEKRGQRDAGWRKTGSSPQAHRTEKQDNRR